MARLFHWNRRVGDLEVQQLSLKNQAVLGALWSISGGLGGRAVGLLGTLALTHFLAPEAYGTVAIGAALVATVDGISRLGLGQFVVAHPDASDRTVFHASLAYLLAGAAAFGAVLAARDLWGWVFDTPELTALLPWLVLSGALDRLAYMPSRVLARDMRFGVLALRGLASEVVYAAVAVLLAAGGAGAAALVWGMLARSAVAALIIVIAVPPARWLRVGRLSRAIARRVLSYSVPLAAAAWLYMLGGRGDKLIVGALLGPAAAGQYNLAHNLADLPAVQIGEHVGDVLLPSFARLPDAAARRRALVRATGLLALVVFPLAVGLGAVAPWLVRAVLGEPWWNIAPLLVVLSALSVMRPVSWLISAYLQAVKRTRTLLWLEAVKTASMVVLLLLLGRAGVLWACVGAGLAFSLYTGASLWVIRRDDGLSLRALMAPIARPFLSCLPMAALVPAACALGGHLGLSPWSSLLAGVVVGAVSYLSAALWLASDVSRELLALLRGALRPAGVHPG